MTDFCNTRICRSVAAWGALGSFALTLCACSVASPLTLRSAANDAIAPDAQIAIAVPGDGAAPLARQFSAALIAALDATDIATSPEGQLIADYSVAVGPAEIGLREAGRTQETPDAPSDWMAEPRPRQRFDECEAQRLRGTLLVLDRSTGETLYRGQGTATECDFGEGDIRELAERLVKDFTARR